VSAFVAGLACTFVNFGTSFWDPPPESTFQVDDQINDVPVEAECPPIAVEDHLPAAAAMLAAKPAVPPMASPERLALADTATPIAAAIVAQAVPASVRKDVAEPQPPVPQPTVTAAPLLPPPQPQPAGPVHEDDAISPPLPPDSPALRALVTRIQPVETLPPPPPRREAIAEPPTAPAPLPEASWSDPDSVNWTESPRATPKEAAAPRPGGKLMSRLADRRTEPAGPVAGRIIDRVRDRLAQRTDDDPAPEVTEPIHADVASDATSWPDAGSLRTQLDRLANDSNAAASTWASQTLASLAAVAATGGPEDIACESALLGLGDAVTAGMTAADGIDSISTASLVRRGALAVARRVSVWRAATTLCEGIAATEANDTEASAVASDATDRVARLLDSLELFESSWATSDAGRVREALDAVTALSYPAVQGLDRAVHDHYLSPNVRISFSERFVESLLPETSVTTSPLHDYVLGKKVRGTKTVEQSTGVRFSPHPSEIRLDLLVTGEVTSRTVTDAGAVAIHSRGVSTFTVAKPIQVSAGGLTLGAARGTASNRSQLAGIETDFDGVPLMGSLVRNIARSQHDEHLEQANREVISKIVGRACREVDQQTEPTLNAAVAKIHDRFWAPLEHLGLAPTAVALETTEAAATARLRLAADTQLAAHTPRPRAPEGSLFSMQVHESTLNNACDRFGLAGQKMTLEELNHTICTKVGLPPSVPDDLPEGVEVTFSHSDPMQVACRDGLVHVRIALDALESGRRSNWYDIVAHVAYRPSISGMQVVLEREGPVQLSGPGHKGRMEFGLRTIFGKIFPKERPVPLVPQKVIANQRLAGVRAVQAVSADGWFAMALAPSSHTAATKTSPTAALPKPASTKKITR